MINPNKIMLRSVIILSYVLITSLIIYGVSSIFSYLNTGADRSSILHTEVKKIDQYVPQIQWSKLNNEGRPMDAVTLKTLEDDYLDAWYIKQLCYMTNSTEGIDDFYTKNARKNIENIVAINTKNNTTIKSTTLEHNPTLEFFSEDGQLAVITDRDVIEYKRIFNNEKQIAERNEKSTYKATLLLEDGFWRIRHLVKVKTETITPKKSTTPIQVSNVKGINYYPQATPWDMYNTTFNETTINNDFKIIKQAGLNTLRIFVPYEDFNAANVLPEKLERLTKVLDIADKHQLKVLVTLFDFYADYSVINWTLNQRHAITIVDALKSHNALLGWDVKNEPNLDFENRGKDLVLAWLDKMVALIKSKDKTHPVTIGWSNVESASLLKDHVDFVSFHYYENHEEFSDKYNALTSRIKDKPVVITEYGMSSYSGIWNPSGNSEDDQAAYHKAMQTLFSKDNIQFMSWTLYDFARIPKEVVGRLPWRQNAQKHFGFIDEHGNKKASFKYISSKK